MEWKAFLTEKEGVSGYNVIGYLDGYKGQQDFDLEETFISLFDFPIIKQLYNAYVKKVEYYKTLETQTEHMKKRIIGLEPKISEYLYLINAIEELNGEKDE